MEATHIGPDELARLQAVQARFRALAQNHDWFGDAIRAAFVGYIGLQERYERESLAKDDRERRLARELLARGLLFDPKARGNSPCLLVQVQGLCVVDLAERLGNYGNGDAMPRKLEREGAAAALAALDRSAIYQVGNTPDKQRKVMAAEFRTSIAAKTHVEFGWKIVVSRPADWQEPADPKSLDRADLERFAEADFRTIALYRLGGLADVGALRPIVPKPKDTDDMVRDVGAYVAWRFRFPINDKDRDQNQPPLSVRALPPDVAEQLLNDVESWVKGEVAARAVDLLRSSDGPALPDSARADALEPYQNKARALVGDNPRLAATMRESTEPFMELWIRHCKAEMEHGKALTAWTTNGRKASEVPPEHGVPNPESNDPTELDRFSTDEQSIVCLFRIGRLASAGVPFPYVDKPQEREDHTERMVIHQSWTQRMGREGNTCLTLDPRLFPPDVARRMLGRVEELGRSAEDVMPPAPPAGAEAIDEHDAALLAFLNRSPSLRRKVSDVRPEKGPQDRKAVAKRLRKLADRTPPLVDYPKDGHPNGAGRSRTGIHFGPHTWSINRSCNDSSAAASAAEGTASRIATAHASSWDQDNDSPSSGTSAVKASVVSDTAVAPHVEATNFNPKPTKVQRKETLPTTHLSVHPGAGEPRDPDNVT